MIQSPLLGYSAFSQLLHRHQQQGAQTSPMTSPLTSPSSLGMARGVVPQSAASGPPPTPNRGVPLPLPVPQFLASSLLQHLQHPQLPLSMTRCPSPASPPSPGSLSSVSPSPSSSPPTSLAGLSSLPSKSFTIDAILGLSQHGPTSHRDAYLGHRGAAHGHYMAEPPSSPTDLSLANSGRPLQPQLSPRRSASGSDGNTSSTSKKSASGGGGGGGKCKRVRTIFTADQLERLEAEFERQQYMVGPERLYLAHALNLTEAQVKVWFQNRRIKWRKQHLEIEQQRLAAIKQHPMQHHGMAAAPPPHHLEDGGGLGGLGGPAHRDLDSGSEDSVLSEDRSYFASLVMPNGVPDDVDADASNAASRRLVNALVGPLASPGCSSPVGSPLGSPLGSPGGHPDGHLGVEHNAGLDQGHLAT